MEAASEDVASLPGDVDLADLQDISDGDMDTPDGELMGWGDGGKRLCGLVWERVEKLNFSTI